MKYENAKDILPAKLLEEVQKYAEGKVIYIPKCEKPKGWGEASGYRDKLNKRNTLICNRYSAGKSIIDIAEEFYLSPETIKKLVYGKKVVPLMFSTSITSAGQYMEAGMGEEWVRTFLAEHGEAMPDSSMFFMSELVRIPLRLIPINADDIILGNNANIKNGTSVKTDTGVGVDNGVETDTPVGADTNGTTDTSVETDTPAKTDTSVSCDIPLVVIYENRKFRVPYQQALLKSLKEEHRNSYYAFIFARNEEYDHFWINYGKHFQR